MEKNKYTSLWDFLRKTPRNLKAILFQTIIGIAAIVSAIVVRDTFDPTWLFYGTLAFATIWVGVCWLRIYLLYKDNK